MSEEKIANNFILMSLLIFSFCFGGAEASNMKSQSIPKRYRWQMKLKFNVFRKGAKMANEVSTGIPAAVLEKYLISSSGLLLKSDWEPRPREKQQKHGQNGGIA